MHAANLVHEANLTSADALPELGSQKLPLPNSAIGLIRRGPIRHFAQPIINRTKNRVKKLFLVARLEMEQRITEIKKHGLDHKSVSIPPDQPRQSAFPDQSPPVVSEEIADANRPSAPSIPIATGISLPSGVILGQEYR